MLVLIAAIFCAGKSFSQTPINLTEEEEQWLVDHPIVTATNNRDLVPFDFYENGEPMGFAVDYLNLIAEKTGLRIEYVSGLSWNELLGKVRSGDIDIVHSLIQNDERSRYLHYTEPYLEIPVVNFGRTDTLPINAIDDLKNKKIGAIDGWAITDDYETLYPEFELVKYDNLEDVLRALSIGEVDVFTGSQFTVEYFISRNFIPNIKVVGRDFLFRTNSVVRHRIATRVDQPVLLSILKKGMDAITPEEFAEISERWRTSFNFSNSIGLSDDELNWLSNNPVINVAIDPQLAPIEFIDENGMVQGVAGEYLNILSEKLNVDFKWTGNSNFSEGVDHVRTGMAHIISAIAPTAERGKEFLLSESYLTASHMIFAPSGAPIYGNLQGLVGKTLVQVRGHTVNEQIKNDYPDLNTITVESINDAFTAISIGQADAYVASLLTSSYYITEGGFLNIAVVGETEYSADTAIGVNADYPLLASAINKAMQSITYLEKSNISNKWFTIKLENRVDTKIIWQVIAVSGSLLIIILLWNDSLRREVSRRKKIETELRVAREAADAANQAKSAFLANMSHEVRTPLNAIIGFSEAMMTGVGGELQSNKHKEYLSDIRNSGEHLAIVVKDILDLSKVEAGKWALNEEKIALDDVIGDCIKMLQQKAKSKNIDLQVKGDKSIIIFADASAMKRAILNLLSNAIKFVDEEGEISITTERTEEKIRILVEDNGIGIPKDRLKHVQAPFEQHQDDYQITQEGTGLGLPIAKKMVELHDGSFILVSKENVGTRAIIELPIMRIR